MRRPQGDRGARFGETGTSSGAIDIGRKIPRLGTGSIGVADEDCGLFSAWSCHGVPFGGGEEGVENCETFFLSTGYGGLGAVRSGHLPGVRPAGFQVRNEFPARLGGFGRPAHARIAAASAPGLNAAVADPERLGPLPPWLAPHGLSAFGGKPCLQQRREPAGTALAASGICGAAGTWPGRHVRQVESATGNETPWVTTNSMRRVR